MIRIDKTVINGVSVAEVSGDGIIIRDTQSALELAMSVKHETGADRFVIAKETNYRIKAAFYGDYSGYTSKPLHDFIYESNAGGSFYFVSTKEEALKRLSEAR